MNECVYLDKICGAYLFMAKKIRKLMTEYEFLFWMA